MKHKKLSARILSLALSAAMLFGVMPITAFATEAKLTKSGAEPVVVKLDTNSITFDARNGATIADTEIKADGTIALPTAPTWETGYAFSGWWTGKDGTGTEVTAKTVHSSGATVYAKWTNGGKTVITEILDFTSKPTTDKLSTEGWKWDASAATLTLSGLTLNRTAASPDEYGNEWGIILLEEEANTIILTDGTVNTVDISRVFVDDSFAAAILSGESITIKTSGKGAPGVLNATSANEASISNIGIYGPYGVTIESGVITAKGGESESESSNGIAADFGTIHIKGGTITAIGTKVGDTVPDTEKYLFGSFGLYADCVKIDGGTVDTTGGEATLSTSTGIVGKTDVILNGGTINAKGSSAAVAAVEEITIADNASVNDAPLKVGKKTISETSFSTLLSEKDEVIENAVIKLESAHTFDQYTVKNGDSFWRIADKYKCNMFELAEINGKTIFSIIYSGDVLQIPQK